MLVVSGRLARTWNGPCGLTAPLHCLLMRVSASGKSFVLGAAPFHFRGVHHHLHAGAASATEDLALLLQKDLAAIAADGYSVVSLPPPSPWAVDILAASGLKCMVDLQDAGLARSGSDSRRAGSRLAR